MSINDHHATGRYAGRDRPVRTIAAAVGLTFLVVGVLGFVPGVTEGVDDLAFAGHESGAELLGLFQVSVLHNALHLAFGVAGLAVARAPRAAVLYLLLGGLAYLALWIYGLVVDQHHRANIVPLNEPDNWLHLGLGVGMVALGLLGRQLWRGNVAERA